MFWALRENCSHYGGTCINPTEEIVCSVFMVLRIEYRLFKRYMEDDDTVFVISSDFCHWGRAFRFQYYHPEDGAIWESIEKLDKMGANYICNHDLDGFSKYIDTYHNTICGRNCIEV